jgi:hypothetical protein
MRTGVAAAAHLEPIDLEPINLDELVALADLQARFDRKYLVPADELPAVLALLPDSTRVLDIDGVRSFGYRSVYLDTPDLWCFHSAGRGRRRRFKVRSRSYLDGDGGTWLEVKTRAARGVTVKARVPHADAQLHGLSLDGHDFVRDTLASRGVDPPDTSALSAMLVTTYLRTTLHLPGHPDQPSTRATIDTDLLFSTTGPQPGSLAAVGLAVVETKGTASPSLLDRRLWRLGHRPVAMSKYGTGLTALRPELPDLKWHRTLHRHLSRTDPTKDLS